MRGDDTYDFGMVDSPCMEGTWYNPSTGDSFTVRDTYFEGDQFYVIAADGRRFNADMIERYVKSDGPIPKKPEIDPNQPKQVLGKVETTKVEASKMMEGLDEDVSMLLKPMQQIPTGGITQTIKTVAVVEDEDTKLAERVLKRTADPVIDAKIKWTKFPTKQLECLMDMMGVDVDVVVDYYINKLDLNEIREELKTQLKDSIIKNFDSDDIVVATPTNKKKKK